MIEILTLDYIEAVAGDTKEDTAQRARENGVKCFLHNGILYRVDAYTEIARGIQDMDLFRASTKKRSTPSTEEPSLEHLCDDCGHHYNFHGFRGCTITVRSEGGKLTHCACPVGTLGNAE